MKKKRNATLGNQQGDEVRAALFSQPPTQVPANPAAEQNPITAEEFYKHAMNVQRHRILFAVSARSSRREQSKIEVKGPVQAAVLALWGIVEDDGMPRLNHKDTGLRLNIKEGVLTRAVDHLLKKGMCELQVLKDGRVKTYKITDKGREHLTEYLAAYTGMDVHAQFKADELPGHETMAFIERILESLKTRLEDRKVLPQRQK